MTLAPKCKFDISKICPFETNEKDFEKYIDFKARQLNKTKDEILNSYRVIDMTSPRFSSDDPDVVIRYCASVLSIPREAFCRTAIWGSNGLTRTNIFNKNTGLDYGFSYKIRKEYDRQFELRRIEHDILNDVKSDRVLFHKHLMNYQDFVRYYYDEEFSEPINYGSDNEIIDDNIIDLCDDNIIDLCDVAIDDSIDMN